ncbi:hypothetical protein FAES_1820 [Fibrella aestuarina BUZ 2]|uniref:Uncharacterized protein n=1 Tax=Fibrella aestuarina BUZ 2 TaxID=1166018 RepID=I0K6S7_9BACT|nr:hypothetical protein [Fibrella aestuarina]CCG99830.1 hypothetical protein FAES_1820 [Fibrella aestuarina BUZ 2]
MASNRNLTGARIAMATIMHTLNNNRKFTNIGTLQALRSPQLAALIAEMNPKNAQNENRLSIIQGQATPTARVQLSYRPQKAGTVKTSRTVASGARPNDAVTLNVDYALHRELDADFETVDFMILEAEAERYLDQVNAGKFVGTAGEYKTMGIVGEAIVSRLESVLQSVNSAALSAVIAAVGGNLTLGATSPTNTAVPDITLYNTDNSIKLDLWEWINNVKTVHAMVGKPIIIGGNKALGWMNRKGIVSMSSIGYDYTKVYNELDFEFYYDPAVDTASGAGHILVLDPGAACLETVMEHEDIIKQKKVANTSYGKAAVAVAQYGADTFAMDLDLRVKEYDTAYPKWTVTPSTQFGIFTRPAGYFKDYGGWDTYTGIVRARLV